MDDLILEMIRELKRTSIENRDTLLAMRSDDEKLFEILKEQDVRITAIEQYIEKQQK